MKRAQILGQVFVFVLAAIIFVLILGYGYRAIKGFTERQEEIVLIDFKTDLEYGVENIKLRPRSVVRIDLRLPTKFTELCLATTYELADLVAFSDFEQRRPAMYRAWLTGTENVFLVPKQKTPILIPAINVTNGYCCLDVGGRVSLRAEGFGDRAQLSPWGPLQCKP